MDRTCKRIRVGARLRIRADVGFDPVWTQREGTLVAPVWESPGNRGRLCFRLDSLEGIGTYDRNDHNARGYMPFEVRYLEPIPEPGD